MMENLRYLDPDTFAACMRISNLLVFVMKNPGYQFKPGQYPYIDNPPQSPFRKGGEATQEAPCPTE